MKPFSRFSAAVVACMLAALYAGGANAAIRNNGQIHRGPTKPTSAAAHNPTHTPRRGTSSPGAPWVLGKNKLPKLSTPSNAIAIPHIKLENEGFTRDQPRRKK